MIVQRRRKDEEEEKMFILEKAINLDDTRNTQTQVMEVREA